MDPKIIPLVLSVLYAVLVILCITEAMNRTPNKKKSSIYLPPTMAWIGALCNLFFLGLEWWAALSGAGYGYAILFGVFILLGMSLMLAWKNHRVTFDKTSFTHRNFL